MKKVFKSLGLILTVIVLFAFFQRLVSADVVTGDSTAYQCVTNIIYTGTDYQNWYNEHCVFPTPSLAPTETPTLTPTPTPIESGPSNPNPPSEGNPMPPACNDLKPNKVPNAAVVAGPGTGQATLSWAIPQGSVNNYSIVYSDDPNSQKWGINNIGNVTTYTISNLSVNKYYFWIYSINGCTMGDAAGPYTVGGVGGAVTGPAVLGLSSTSSDTNYLIIFAQLFLALTLAVAGLKFYKRNA
jgi:hypothetical protein